LQSDYKLLQDSYDQLEASRDAIRRELTAEVEELKAERVQLGGTKRESESSVLLLRENIEALQSALDQSEFQLVECEKSLQVYVMMLQGWI
jgi:chromosome segregation ATPase